MWITPNVCLRFGWAENSADNFICWRHRQIMALTAVSVVEWGDWKNKQGFSCPDCNTADTHMSTQMQDSEEYWVQWILLWLPVQNGELKVKPHSLYWYYHYFLAVYLTLFQQNKSSISQTLLDQDVTGTTPSSVHAKPSWSSNPDDNPGSLMHHQDVSTVTQTELPLIHLPFNKS